MALALKDRVKETTIVVGTGAATLLGSSIGFQPFSVVGNGNTTYYCISDQFGSNWEVGIGTYSSSGNTLARTTVLASSNAGALVTFTAGIKDVFVTYPAEKGVWLDASGNAIGLGTPAAFVGTNITGTASGLTAGNVTTNANLTGAVTSTGNATSLGSFTSLQLATALTNETGTGSAVFSDNASLLNPTYTGTLTGSTGILNIGSGQVYKDASGNVGIGTSSPQAKEHIAVNTTAITETLRLDNIYNTGDNGNKITWYNAATSVEGANISGFRLGATTGFGLSFSTSSNFSTTAAVERMRIDSSGNVGIGTSSPITSSKLSIYAGATTGTTYNVLAATGGSIVTKQQQSTSVSTGAVVILTSGLYASFCVVFGSDGTNRFMDLILCGLGSGTIQVVSSFSVAGSPAARTYTQASSTYRLAMGSGTYTVSVAATSMTG
jgi:hypothetical protein